MVLTKSGNILVEELNGVSRYALNHVQIYKIRVGGPLHYFTNVFLIKDKEVTLVDTGFYSKRAISDLEQGLLTINEKFGEKIRFEDIENIFITHGHGDHFGMLAYEKLKEKKVYIHPLDTAILEDYQVMDDSWKRHLTDLAMEGGCKVDMQRGSFTHPFDVGPNDYYIIKVSDKQKIINSYTVHHTPGHSLGHICLQIGEVLFLGDHVLSDTTPHQTPKTSWQGAGLRAYLDSLEKVAGVGIEIGFGAHEEVINVLSRRIEEIKEFHAKRLDELIALCCEAKNLYQLTYDYYRLHPEYIDADSIDKLNDTNKAMAMEEILAHVEYLLEDNRIFKTATNNEIVEYRSA